MSTRLGTCSVYTSAASWVDRLPGLSLPEVPLTAFDPDQQVREAVVRALTHTASSHLHRDLSRLVTATRAWPGGSTGAGVMVEWDVAALSPLTTQLRVCDRVLLDKCDPVSSAPQWSPTFLAYRDQVLLLDGHHSFALAHIAHRLGLVAGPVPAYLYRYSPAGYSRAPRLHCPCP